MNFQIAALLMAASLVGCLALSQGPDPAEPLARGGEDGEPTPMSATFDVVVSQLMIHVVPPVGVAMGFLPANECVQIASEGTTSVAGTAAATWVPDTPTTERLRLGSVYFKVGSEWRGDVVGPSPLHLDLEEFTVHEDDDFVVYLGLPAEPGVEIAINQSATLALDLTYVGDPIELRPGSCTFGQT